MKKCIICRKNAETHHLLTQKSYPELKDEPFNRIEVCREHHQEFHTSGISHMAEKYFQVKVWLHNNKWFFDESRNKYRPSQYTVSH